MHPQELMERIEKAILKTEYCWLWQGSVNTSGYGVIGVKGKKRLVHRLIWEESNGQPIPDGMSICHHCDNPLCVRPSHLFAGTHSDNMRDASRKGRLRIPKGTPNNLFERGESNPSARLTEDQVRAIRRLYATEMYTHSRLSKMFDVSRGTIWRVLKNNNWKHLE